jgi:hypothetical protein
LHPCRHLSSDFGETRTHGRGQIEHLHPFTIEANLSQQTSDVFDPALRCYITFQVMAIPFQSASNHYAVHTPFKGVEHLYHVEFPRTGDLDDTYISWILKSQCPS